MNPRPRPDSFIFRNADGCAFGLADVNQWCPTETAAWYDTYGSDEAVEAARARGVTVTRQPWAEYNAQGVYDCLGSKCDHVRQAVA